MILLTDGLMQIGWADSLFRGDSVCGQGVGDHPHSWAIDGFRCKKWNNSSADYGQRWQAGDVVGCLLDLSTAAAPSASFFLNGRNLGVAFTHLQVAGAVYPAASLNVDQAAHFNFGPPHSNFVYPPPLFTPHPEREEWSSGSASLATENVSPGVSAAAAGVESSLWVQPIFAAIDTRAGWAGNEVGGDGLAGGGAGQNDTDTSSKAKQQRHGAGAGTGLALQSSVGSSRR